MEWNSWQINDARNRDSSDGGPEKKHDVKSSLPYLSKASSLALSGHSSSSETTMGEKNWDWLKGKERKKKINN